MMREISPDIRVRSEHSEMIPLRYYNKARVKNKWSGCEWSMQGVYIHLSLVTCWENREDFLTESELERFTDMLRVREIFLVRGFSLLEEPKAPLRDHIALSGFWEPPTYYQHTIWAVKLLLVSVRQGTGWTSQLKIFYRAKVKALPVISIQGFTWWYIAKSSHSFSLRSHYMSTLENMRYQYFQVCFVAVFQ